MSVDIQARGFELTEPLEQYTRQRISTGLGDRLDSINNVRVGLFDINGPKGGADKCCRVHITLPRQRDVIVEDTQTDMYNAISSALRRASHVLGRRLSKLRVRPRGPGRRRLAHHTADAAA